MINIPPSSELLAACWLLAVIATVALSGFIFRHKLGPRGLAAFLLLIFLSSCFALLIALNPRGEIVGGLGALVLIGSFWLMSRFEGFDKPPENKP